MSGFSSRLCLYSMKFLFLYFLLVFQPGIAFSQDEDTLSGTRITGQVLLANIGFAPIPAFSFNSPILIGSLNLRKNRFSFEPDIAVGLNGKPWMANNWFRYNLNKKNNLQVKLGINPFLFFEEQNLSSETLNIHIQRNLTFEILVNYDPSDRLSFHSFHRFNSGHDGALTGHVFEIGSSIYLFNPINRFNLSISPDLFYFDFTDKVDGLFISNRLRLTKKNFPFNVYLQGVFPLVVDFSGSVFKWNAGLVYSFQL